MSSKIEQIVVELINVYNYLWKSWQHSWIKKPCTPFWELCFQIHGHVVQAKSNSHFVVVIDCTNFGNKYIRFKVLERWHGYDFTYCPETSANWIRHSIQVLCFSASPIYFVWPDPGQFKNKNCHVLWLTICGHGKHKQIALPSQWPLNPRKIKHEDWLQLFAIQSLVAYLFDGVQIKMRGVHRFVEFPQSSWDSFLDIFPRTQVQWTPTHQELIKVCVQTYLIKPLTTICMNYLV